VNAWQLFSYLILSVLVTVCLDWSAMQQNYPPVVKSRIRKNHWHFDNNYCLCLNAITVCLFPLFFSVTFFRAKASACMRDESCVSQQNNKS